MSMSNEKDEYDEQRDDQRCMYVLVNNGYQDQIASFKKIKNDEQIFISSYDSFESTTYPKGISQFQDFQ
jgi:hypothetical protein